MERTLLPTSVCSASVKGPRLLRAVADGDAVETPGHYVPQFTVSRA
ncbi:hypothetical protein JOF56_008194 [Kibdelosporangium banguiense]|uniref:Uncharacterized protein n=1 Tax=Kibdelosporangium banguiense TaxID=1365924 RepID=A0ABS4TTT3_9PSEU|nr:hypothetical protein [Kibdelosporangium banguiense]MBP2327809.1 hypothetical protein [Kibdelosporangium banguiense]